MLKVSKDILEQRLKRYREGLADNAMEKARKEVETVYQKHEAETGKLIDRMAEKAVEEGLYKDQNEAKALFQRVL